MTKEEALKVIADGHTFWNVDHAEKVCKAFGLELPKSLIETYANQKEANPDNHFKGLFIQTDKWPVSGVSSYRLSNFVTSKLGVKGGDYFGRGTQARSNAEAIRKKFGIKR